MLSTNQPDNILMNPVLILSYFSCCKTLKISTTSLTLNCCQHSTAFSSNTFKIMFLLLVRCGRAVNTAPISSVVMSLLLSMRPNQSLSATSLHFLLSGEKIDRMWMALQMSCNGNSPSVTDTSSSSSSLAL